MQCFSVEHTALVSGNHILNIDESVFSSVDLKHLESLLDQVAQVEPLSLAVVDLISQVLIPDLE